MRVGFYGIIHKQTRNHTIFFFNLVMVSMTPNEPLKNTMCLCLIILNTTVQSKNNNDVDTLFCRFILYNHMMRNARKGPSSRNMPIKFTPLKAHFYIVKLGFTLVYIVFLIDAQKHRLWAIVRTALPRRS